MATETCSLLSLPPEILIRVLSSSTLEDIDVCNMSEVCRSLHEVCSCSDVWKRKLRQRWPACSAEVDKGSLRISGGGGDGSGDGVDAGWRGLFKSRKSVWRQVQRLLQSLAADNYHLHEVSDCAYTPFLQLAETHRPHGISFIFQDLHDVLDTDSKLRLTDKYYGKKALYFLRHRTLRDEWKSFLSLPPEQQAIEKGAVLVSDWMRPMKGVSLSAIVSQLDDIADTVRIALKSKCPGHPACSKDNAHTDFAESLWSTDQCRDVLLTLNQVLFQQLGFTANSSNYLTPENSYIDEVLHQKKGIPISLSVIYASVARRLGVCMEPVNFPTHFLLRWREHPMAAGLDQYTFVDAYHEGKFRSSSSCLRDLLDIHSAFDENIFAPTTLAKVFERSARNLVSIARTFADTEDHIRLLRDATSLYLAISPEDHDMTMLNIRISMYLKINLGDAVSSLQRLVSDHPAQPTLVHECEQLLLSSQVGPDEVIPRRRADYADRDVKFSVGMVMKHKRYDYMCVIYGWDCECEASTEWIVQMGVDRLQDQHRQPFYNVLVPDGSNRYAAQENLLYTRTTEPISHAEVGKFFCEFTGSHYLPNEHKAREYPDDTQLTRTLVSDFLASGDQGS